MTIEVLDPTYDGAAASLTAAKRLEAIRGASVGIVSNGKQGTGRFFRAVAERLESHHGVSSVDIVTKPNYSAPAPPDVIDRAQEWNALISGIGD